MNETVTITPTQGKNTDGDPLPAGDPFDVLGLVAPGNTSYRFNDQGELDSAAFTVYLPIGTAIKDDDRITVRDRVCVARVREWHSMRTTRANLEVLCLSVTGVS